ncbi:Fic family protein, partial [Actinocatenispora rupis]
HYQFEALHPYNNGNGRLGRLIAVLQLVQEGILHQPVLNLAPWLENRRDEYIDGLLSVSKTGDWNPWVSFISTAILTQAEEGIRTISDLIEFKAEMIRRVRDAKLRGAAVELAEILIGYPLIDVQTASSLIGKTFETANQAVSKLVSLGILHEVTGRRVNRLFVCKDILDITSGRRLLRARSNPNELTLF